MKLEDIKFKAKRLDNGEWVIGDLMRESYGARIIERTSKTTNWIAVDPNTVCQFTGLKDCKGNEVWEGDIIKDPYTSEKNTIEWNDHLCCFNTVDKIHGSRYYLEKAIKELGWHVIDSKFNINSI